MKVISYIVLVNKLHLKSFTNLKSLHISMKQSQDLQNKLAIQLDICQNSNGPRDPLGTILTNSWTNKFSLKPPITFASAVEIGTFH